MKHLSVIALIGCLVAGSNAFGGREFGSRGYSGANGRTGDHGRNGEQVVRTFTGQSESINLSGYSGGRGYDGRYGEDARFCSQPSQVAYDLEGAPGGDGGDGGAGGDGGQGGVLTAYFADINHLKTITVFGTPGTGGPGGSGGRYGYGCRCRVHSWIIKDNNGNARTYYCRDGERGREGWYGRTGATGQYGYAVLIPQLTPVLPDEPIKNFLMETIEQGPFPLSKNVWTTQSGASQLFAAGSRLRDQYLYYSGRIEKTVGFRWEVPRPLTDFTGTTISSTLSETGSIVIGLPREVWAEGVEEPGSNGLTYVFARALYEREAINLAVSGIAGSSQTLEVLFSDPAKASEWVKTNVALEYRTANGAFGYQTRYNGPIPSELITWDGTHLKIALGKLDLHPGYLKPGTLAQMNFTITRSMGSRSARVSLQRNGRI